MKNIHRIAFRATSEQRRTLEELGVDVPPGIVMPGGAGDPLVAFDVDEEHANWSSLRALFEQWNAFGSVRTKFSKKEIDAAAWLRIVGDWHHGYPQPEDGFGYRKVTYDLAEYCDRCGIGLKQKAPFQMKAEPKWGRRGILQLNWVFDEYFVTPEVWTRVFEPHGIGCRPVVNTKGVQLKTVVQLVTREDVHVVVDGLPSEEVACSKCGRTKFLPVTRGPFPAPVIEPSTAMVKTEEYFGSGASAYKGVLVARAVAQALIAHKVRGASLCPTADRSGRAD